MLPELATLRKMHADSRWLNILKDAPKQNNETIWTVIVWGIKAMPSTKQRCTQILAAQDNGHLGTRDGGRNWTQ